MKRIAWASSLGLAVTALPAPLAAHGGGLFEHLHPHGIEVLLVGAAGFAAAWWWRRRTV